MTRIQKQIPTNTASWDNVRCERLLVKELTYYTYGHEPKYEGITARVSKAYKPKYMDTFSREATSRLACHEIDYKH
jgi:hypothetical protein